MNHKKPSGFTLIEILIAIAIVSLIVSLGYPSYEHHVKRAKITEATTVLSELHLLSTQQFQDDRTYIKADNSCVVNAPNTDYFTFHCTATTDTYAWIAKNKANSGLGNQNDYAFSIDHLGNKSTQRFSGNTVSQACWILKKSTTC